jgi:hypothetical protein
VAAFLLVAMLAPTAGAQSVEARVGQITQRLERMGYKVLDAGFLPGKDTLPPVWIVLTAAKYSRPSWSRVSDQTMTVWNVMFSVLRSENPNTLFSVGHDWGKYRLLFSTQHQNLATFDAKVRAAKGDAEGQQASQALWKAVAIRIYEMPSLKQLKVNDFVSKYFVEDKD